MTDGKTPSSDASHPSSATPPAGGGRGMRRFAAIFAGLAALLIVAALAVAPRLLEDASDGPAAIGGPFTLIDQTGKTVTDKDFRGKLMLVYFGYTYCPDLCPTTLGTLTQALDQLPASERAQVAPIFITVDPERDTVDQMSEYVANFAPDLEGLTGTPDQVKAAMQSYRVYARKANGQDGNYSVDHSSILYVMDKKGKFASHFDSNASAEQIAAGIKKLLASG